MSVREVYTGRIIELRLEDAELPNGKSITLEVVHHPGAAAIVALDAHGEVTLLRQWRHAAGGYIWELPAGLLASPSEPPEQCARRELREETGLEARDVVHLGTIFTTPGFCDERIHLFLARGLVAGGHAHEHDEVIAEIAHRPLAEALDMIRRGDIVDGKTIAGLHLAAAALAAA